jgi:hypothetical protein
MIRYKIKFVTEKHTEETTAAEFKVTVHQYMKILGQVRKLKGIR